MAFAKFKEAVDQTEPLTPATPLLDNQSEYNIVELSSLAVTEEADDMRNGPQLAAPARMLSKPGESFFAFPISGRKSVSDDTPDDVDDDDDMLDDDMEDMANLTDSDTGTGTNN